VLDEVVIGVDGLVLKDRHRRVLGGVGCVVDVAEPDLLLRHLMRIFGISLMGLQGSLRRRLVAIGYLGQLVVNAVLVLGPVDTDLRLKRLNGLGDVVMLLRVSVFHRGGVAPILFVGV